MRRTALARHDAAEAINSEAVRGGGGGKIVEYVGGCSFMAACGPPDTMLLIAMHDEITPPPPPPFVWKFYLSITFPADACIRWLHLVCRPHSTHTCTIRNDLLAVVCVAVGHVLVPRNIRYVGDVLKCPIYIAHTCSCHVLSVVRGMQCMYRIV